MPNLGNYTFAITLLTLLSTIIFGIMNYRIKSQARKLKEIKGDYSTILDNTLGYIELEQKYSEAYAEKSGKSAHSVKLEFRKGLSKPINSDFSGERKITNLIEQINKI